MSEDVRIRLDMKPRALACNHDPRNGTLERIGEHTYRCKACGIFFMVGTMEKEAER